MAEILVVLLPPGDVGEGDTINGDAALENTAIRVTEELLPIVSHVGHLVGSCALSTQCIHTQTPLESLDNMQMCPQGFLLQVHYMYSKYIFSLQPAV